MILSEGCDGYIRKPFRETEIFDELEKHLGIKFVYEEAQPFLPGEDGKTLLFNIQAALDQLSAPQISGLHQAITSGDVALINHLLDGITGQSPELAIRLREMVEGYDFNQLIKYLDEARRKKDNEE
jgi:hypothetical protein